MSVMSAGKIAVGDQKISENHTRCLLRPNLKLLSKQNIYIFRSKNKFGDDSSNVTRIAYKIQRFIFSLVVYYIAQYLNMLFNFVFFHKVVFFY